MTTAGATLRAVAARPTLTDVELVLLGVIAGLAALLVVVATLRALAARWRSAPSVERLAEGLRTALVTLLCTIGTTMLCWQVYATWGTPPDADILATVQVALVGAPTLLGALVLVLALRRRRALQLTETVEVEERATRRVSAAIPFLTPSPSPLRGEGSQPVRIFPAPLPRSERAGGVRK